MHESQFPSLLGLALLKMDYRPKMDLIIYL
jgi:hypothetical protein